jgi:hypothetical protein
MVHLAAGFQVAEPQGRQLRAAAANVIAVDAVPLVL